MGDNVREDIEAAMQSLEGGDDGAGGGGGAEGAGGVGPGGGGADGAVSAGQASGDGEGEFSGDAGQGAASGRPRDESGRFAKKPKDATKAQVAGKADATAAPTAAAPTTTQPPVAPAATQTATPPPGQLEPLKPPQSWKPGTRELWASLPRPVQEEVLRREKEAATGIQELAPYRKQAEAWNATLAPYEAALRAQGVEPQALAGNLMQTYLALTNGPVGTRAQILANMLRNSGVPPELFAQAYDSMSGTAPPAAGAGQAQGYVDPRVEALEARLQQQEARIQQAWEYRQQQLRAKAESDIEAFRAGPGAEFISDVEDDMALLVAQAAQRGKRMSLQEAYDRACWAHPDIRAILQTRQAGEAAKAVQASTQQARAASSSVRSQPTGVQSAPQSGSVEDDVRAAVAALSGR